MKKLYQVLADDYDGTFVGPAFESEEMAEKFAEWHNERNDWFYGQSFYAEELLVHDSVDEAIAEYTDSMNDLTESLHEALDGVSTPVAK